MEARRVLSHFTPVPQLQLASGTSIFQILERTMTNQSSHHNQPNIMESASAFFRLTISPHPVAAGWYAVPLRLIVGLGFIEHGYAKLSRGAQAFITILHAIGMPFADLLGWATIVVEIIGGLLILFGAFVRIAALPMIIVLLVAIFTVHLPNGFSSIKLMSYDATGAHFGQPGYETDLLYMAGLLALCIGGAGPFSLDAHLTRRLLTRTRTQT
jgi:putative oxidoreductase